MPKLIRVKGAGWAIVDDDMAEEMAKYSWHKDSTGYARRGSYCRATKKNTTVRMHKMILPGHRLLDHRNRDKLDNRRENLRPSNAQSNQLNSKRNRNNTSGYRNIIWSKSISRWYVQVRRDGKRNTLGCFKSKIDAIKSLFDFRDKTMNEQELKEWYIRFLYDHADRMRKEADALEAAAIMVEKALGMASQAPERPAQQAAEFPNPFQLICPGCRSPMETMISQCKRHYRCKTCDVDYHPEFKES